MPGIMIERPKMTRTMYQALKRNIMKEREKKKQEQEQDEELARQKKERELKKKKEQEDSLTLEQTKDQISDWEKKLDKLKQDKHQLFSQLKKVLHQEDESKKRMKESEMVQSMQHYSQPVFLQGHGHINPPTKYMNVAVHRSPYANNKRPRSPSPQPQVSMYGNFAPHSKYQVPAYSSNVKQERYPNPKAVGYSAAGNVVPPPANYPSSSQAAGSSHMYQTPPQPPQSSMQPAPTSGKYSSGQSAFTSYPSHFAHQQQQQQQQMKEHFPPGPNYRVQMPQQGRAFLAGHGSNIPLQQQLQHADKTSGFAEDKFKLQSAGAVRGMAHIAGHQQQQQQAGLITQPPQTAKGGITSGFPVRTQTSSSAYQPSASQAVSSSSQHPYAHTRYVHNM